MAACGPDQGDAAGAPNGVSGQASQPVGGAPSVGGSASSVGGNETGGGTFGGAGGNASVGGSHDASGMGGYVTQLGGGAGEGAGVGAGAGGGGGIGGGGGGNGAAGSPSKPNEPTIPGSCAPTGRLPPADEWRFFDIRGPGDRSQYYVTRGAVEVFMTDDPNGGAIERSEKASYFWNDKSGWAEFCAHYEAVRGGGSILQIKIRDEAVPVLMVSRNKDGLSIPHGNTVKGQSLKTPPAFDLRVRNDGTNTEVYVDGKRWVKFTDARPGLHFFKYGLYHGTNLYQSLDAGSVLRVSNVSLVLDDPIKL